MLRPEPMSRVLLVGPREELDEAIEALYGLKLVHVVDYREEDETLKMGKPLPKAAEISENLIKMRSISTILQSQKVKSPPTMDIVGNLREKIAALEINITEEDLNRKKTDALLSDLDRQIEDLSPFAELPLSLDIYRGYESLAVFVGRISHHIEGIDEVSPEREVFHGEHTAAVFVPKEKAEAVRDLLLKQGFSSLSVPDAAGDPKAKLDGLLAERDKRRRRMAEIDERLAKLRERYAGFVIAAEKQLGVEIEKAEAPLRFATSEHSFVIDGWIPSAKFDDLHARLGGLGSIFLSKVEGKDDEAPTLLRNSRPVRPFESFIHLFSTPSYKELDPTIVLSLVFPIFFGFMIGDAGYGAVWLVLGIIALKKLDKGGFRDLVFAVTLGGFFSLIFGLFLYGEAFGMPFIAHVTADNPHAMGWDTSMGIHIPIASVFHKLENPVELILLSIIAAFIHLGIGFLFGFVNEWRRNKKHGIAKLSWLLILTGLFMVIMARAARWPGFGRELYTTLFGWVPGGGLTLDALGFMGANPMPFAALALIIGGIVILIFTESALAPVEVVGLFANMMSYSRLAGVAMAKAATAEAFNTIVFTAAAPGGAYIAVGLVLAVVFHMIIFFLGAVSAGIQAIRLNYVEFFLKFFKGNGTMFRPFGTGKATEV